MKTLKLFFLFLLFVCSFMRLDAAGDLEGTVTNANTGAPIQGARVEAIRGSNLIDTDFTNSSGFYEMLDLNPSNYTIICSQSGFLTETLGVKVKNKDVTVLDIELTPIGGGTISGTVVDTGMGAISGATVNIFQGNTLVGTTTTNVTGDYSVADLPAAFYTVVASAPTFQAEAQGANVSSGSTTTVNFELESMPGTISGTVTESGTGTPLESALVSVFSGSTLIESALTNGAGAYSIADLAPGNYIVVANAFEHQEQAVGASVTAGMTTTVSFVLETDPGAVGGRVSSSTTSNPIVGATVSIFQDTVLISSVLTDDNGNYDFSELAPGQYTLVASADNFQGDIQGVSVASNAITTANFSLEPSPGTISGTVKEVDEDPIVGANVSVLQGFTIVGSAITDSSGFYSVPDLAPGSYRIVATAPTFQLGLAGAIVTSNSTSNVDFVLKPLPGSLSGTVEDISTAGIAGATVSVYYGTVLIAQTLTDSSGTGSYSFPTLPPGSFTVVADATDFQTSSLGVTITSGGMATADFVLLADPGTIAGRVTSSQSGDPISGARISVLHQLTLISTAVTDSDGNYSIPGLAPERYIVVANADNFQVDIVGSKVLSNTTSTINFALDPRPGILEGTVTNSMTSEPILGAIVAVFDGPIFIESTLTNPNGNYQFIDLAPGSYQVVAQADTFQIEGATATIASNQTSTLNFSLTPDPGTIFGTVKDTGAMGIPDASVFVFQDNAFITSALTDASGAYNIFNLAPGTYTVLAAAEGFEFEFDSVLVTAGGMTEKNFVLAVTEGQIAGTITNLGNGSPVPRGLTLSFEGSTLVAFDLSDPSGNYEMEGLTATTYTVTASAPNFLTGVDSASVSGGATTTVNFVLTPVPEDIPGINGKAFFNDFITQKERVHKIGWGASPSDFLTGYRILRNGVQIGFVPFGAPLSFEDHNRSKKQADVYTVIAVNSFNQESTPISITLK